MGVAQKAIVYQSEREAGTLGTRNSHAWCYSKELTKSMKTNIMSVSFAPHADGLDFQSRMLFPSLLAVMRVSATRRETQERVTRTTNIAREIRWKKITLAGNPSNEKIDLPNRLIRYEKYFISLSSAGGVNEYVQLRRPWNISPNSLADWQHFECERHMIWTQQWHIYSSKFLLIQSETSSTRYL